ncbi:MAG TPA: FMN-binding negative transcriptional regulator [Rhizomicrobium sp.]|nr:FMN-binding negative transcriptional regulator [Rhizomicrobium sp.]
MYRPRAFAVDDAGVLRAFVGERAFATVALAIEGRIHFAYTPVVLDGGGLGRICFHLAKANPVCAAADGQVLQFSFLGDDAYISPDWYASKGRVPTWNYTAVEAAGVARKLSRDELHQLLVDLSADQETRLLPKEPWRIDKVEPAKLASLLEAIEGFEVALDKLEGKFKLSQNVGAADMAGVIDALEKHGDEAGRRIAKAMKRASS